ncbi:uridine-cytidine kinase-like 1, partial [Limulus polyphemus]|uniref:Uridine-cytidine kinase-like 1 n=1 Tax=Limulus polyphemus TaxID=6850 RepID=A0ABM1B966_LIMPO
LSSTENHLDQPPPAPFIQLVTRLCEVLGVSHMAFDSTPFLLAERTDLQLGRTINNSISDYPMGRGEKLHYFLDICRSFTRDPWVHHVLASGLIIQFTSPPLLSAQPVAFSTSTNPWLVKLCSQAIRGFGIFSLLPMALYIRALDEQVRCYQRLSPYSHSEIFPEISQICAQGSGSNIVDCNWWLGRNNTTIGVPIPPPPPNIHLFTDAFFQGWGAYLQGQEFQGIWTEDESTFHINILNLLAVHWAMGQGGENHIAINLIVQHVHTQLQLRGLKLRSKLAHTHIGQPLPNTLHIMPSTPQILGMHTFIRNCETSRDEFIFYSKRLMRLLIEYALSLLQFRDVIVETPQGCTYHGKRSTVQKICGVSIMRAGETMEQALRDCLKDVRLGKILIQTNLDTGEPELYYLRLPRDIKDYQIILMDATVASGAAAMMATRVLLDHDVPEDNILFCSLLAAESGVHTIAYAFPKVHIVTTAVDPEVNKKFYILPGIGNFGDRYFGTEAS